MTLGETVSLADLESDPDTILAAMRVEEPVSWVPALGMWLVTRWDDVATIEADPATFSAATDPSFLARALGPNMLTMDPPEHTRIQAMLRPTFQPGGRSGDFVRDELVPLAETLLDEIDGTFDLMEAYAQPLSAGALATVLGLIDDSESRNESTADGAGGIVRETAWDLVWRWCEGLCADIANFENDPAITAVGTAAKDELGAAIRECLDASPTSGRNGGIHDFAAAGATTTEIINNVRLMISGGINEPRDGIGLTVWVLLSRPDLRLAVEREPRLMRRLIEEVFRVYSPVGTVTRQTTRGVELGGVVIPSGDLVAGVLRSVNLDATHWDDPDEIRLDRTEGSHAAFALGAHRCLGEWLGRQEVRVGVERLFARFPDLKLAAGHDVALHGFEFRGPRALWVTT